MVPIGMVLVFIAVVLVAYLVSLDGSYKVDRSIVIKREPQQVFDRVRDFPGWKDWSPWLMHEPDATLEYSEHPDQEGGWYSWAGELIGAGKLTHGRFDEPSKIDQQIEFTRPFRSVVAVGWRFEPCDDGTRVHWLMTGRMPFLFRFMAAKTQAMIEKDYDLGLALLRGVLDPQAETPRLEFVGETVLAPWHSLAYDWSGSFDDMPAVMQQQFPLLAAEVEQQGRAPAGPAFTAYHKVDQQQLQTECSMAIVVDSETRAGSMALKDMGGGRYYKVTLQGSYSFLGLAWYSANSHLRMHKVKRDGSRPSLEVYENDPGAVSDSNELLTTLYLPVK